MATRSEVAHLSLRSETLRSTQPFVTILERPRVAALVAACGNHGVELNWFGDDEPKVYTSRYDSWLYLDDVPRLPRTLAVLSETATCASP